MKHLQTAQKIIMYLALTQPEQPWSTWAQTVLVPHLRDLRSELHRTHTRRSAVLATQELAQPEEKHATAGEYLSWIEELKHKGLAAAASLPGADPLPFDAACLVRDATMLTTAVGHTALMHRGSVITSIKASCFAATPCPMGDACPAAGLCCGNRVERVSPTACKDEFVSSFTALPQPHQYQLVVPHHKASNRGVVGAALPIPCPLACQLLEVYERRARPTLTFTEDADGPVEVLFVDNMGKPFTAETLCLWWTKAHK